MAPQREWFDTDYYAVLGVPQSATAKDIARAYRKLAKELHPDVNPGEEERFKKVTAANDVLSDKDKRAEYDEVRRLGAMGGIGGFGRRGGSSAQFRLDDLGDLFSGLFTGGASPADVGGFSWSTGRGPGPQRGQDVDAELHLSFDEAVEGGTTTVQVVTGSPCSACQGSGAAPGTTPVQCKRCKGKGVVQDNKGLFQLAQPCPECGGRGVRVVTPCSTCAGTGVERHAHPVRVRLPAGVEDGQRIRVKGRGEPGRNNGPAGDLYVIAHVAPHKLFGRHGRDLTLRVPVSFAEAALGATIRVPTLDGGPVALKVPAGTPNGRRFRVKGHGVHTPRWTGDLLVRVDVAVPENLTEEQRSAVEALAMTMPDSVRAHLGV